MRLRCEVEVLSQLLPSCGLQARGRAAQAVVSLGRPPGGPAVALLVCTARDRSGARYKVRSAPGGDGEEGTGAVSRGARTALCPQVQNNVERLFTRFVEQGKATVRLREPPVDLRFSKANVSTLKTFLSALRLAHQGTDTALLPLSTLVAAKSSEVEKPKTKMTITSRRDYPLTKGFPSSLEHLQTSYCQLARVDTRLLSLRTLRRLDLSHNHIKQLPAALGELPCLQELDLHDNHLEAFSGALCRSGLQRCLQLLDLSRNRLRALPLELCQLRALVTVRLDDNELLRLPCRLGQLCRLRSLSAARNRLPFLPCDFRRLRLESLDLFGNPFEPPRPLEPNVQLKIPPSLLECAARATVDHRIPYGCHLLPSHLCEDLEVAKTCQCGSACLSSFIQITVTMNLHHVAHTVVLVDNMGGTDAPILCYFCSLHCYSQFLDRHLQSNG
ncbi:LLR1 protein, partial [Formicarius rufipectus]|nr:LLR1 protein [Formicarius rufipectus]